MEGKWIQVWKEWQNGGEVAEEEEWSGNSLEYLQFASINDRGAELPQRW